MPKTGLAHSIQSLGDREVRVWILDLDAPWAHAPELGAVLSDDEGRRAARFITEELRRRFVAGRGALRFLLGDVLGEAPEQLEFQESDTGRPFLANQKLGVDFNVSHAGCHALIAATRGRRVGVDIEQIRPVPEVDSLVERFFAKRERELFSDLPTDMRLRAFFAVWTRKEAFAKATGRGIASTLHRFAVSVDPDSEPILLDIEWPGDDPTEWTLLDLPPRDGLASAIAVEGVDWQFRIDAWEPLGPGSAARET